MSMEQIQGTWLLDAFEIVEKGAAARNWGTNTHGLLIYAPSGYMSVSINKDVSAGSSNEFENLFDSILFYSGSYEVEGDLIRHQVTEASSPGRIGREMLRYAKFDATRLVLKTPEESWGHAILTWKRVTR